MADEIEQSDGSRTATSPKKLWKSPRGSWKSKAQIVGDIVHIDTSRLWDVVREKSRPT
jgi:hypothetical protein